MNAETTAEAQVTEVPVELQSLRAGVDQSARVPVLYFLTTASAWLVVAAILGFIASVKSYYPDFLGLDSLYFLHYGRVQPAFVNAFVYGWGFQAGVGVMIWIMARLCRAEVASSKIMLFAGLLWNIGVTLGVFSILWGGNTSVEMLEFPKWVWPILFVAYLFMTAWVVILFKARQAKNIYISVWYFLGACFWFPWIYGTANLLIHHFDASGTMSAAIDGWYISNLMLLFFVPVGLGTSYYLIPKVLGRPIHSYQLALIGFWMLAALSGWTGVQKLMGGPVPPWMSAIGSAAAILMLIPVGVVALNHHLTTRGDHRRVISKSPTMRFTIFGAMSYTFMSVILAAMSTFFVSRYSQFTHADSGFQMLLLYAFFTMSMFGAYYFIMPRVSGCEWPSGRMISLHFWCSTYGLTALVLCLFCAGLSQGFSVQNPENWANDFYGPVVKSGAWLRGTSIAWGFLTFANIVFFIHVVLMALRLGRKSADGPTMFPAGGSH